MTVKLVEELWCDRCKTKFERQDPTGVVANTLTMGIWWLKFLNGTKSRNTNPSNGSWEKYDLCPDCTGEFVHWWQNPPKRGTDASA